MQLRRNRGANAINGPAIAAVAAALEQRHAAAEAAAQAADEAAAAAQATAQAAAASPATAPGSAANTALSATATASQAASASASAAAIVAAVAQAAFLTFQQRMQLRINRGANATNAVAHAARQAELNAAAAARQAELNARFAAGRAARNAAMAQQREAAAQAAAAQAAQAAQAAGTPPPAPSAQAVPQDIPPTGPGGQGNLQALALRRQQAAAYSAGTPPPVRSAALPATAALLARVRGPLRSASQAARSTVAGAHLNAARAASFATSSARVALDSLTAAVNSIIFRPPTPTQINTFISDLKIIFADRNLVDEAFLHQQVRQAIAYVIRHILDTGSTYPLKLNNTPYAMSELAGLISRAPGSVTLNFIDKPTLIKLINTLEGVQGGGNRTRSRKQNKRTSRNTRRQNVKRTRKVRNTRR